MKTRNYNKEFVELCRNCKGSGVEYPVPEFHAHGREKEVQPHACPVCGGRGRVRKRVEVEVTIEPFTGPGVM
jgi:DnaJ-class molecular chaperone